MDILVRTDRKKIEELYKTWTITHGVKDCSESLLAYLAGEGLLNVEKSREFLKTKEKK